ncbi:hypothetical protein SCHPADRAFT_849248 [Schizopora paradoxa]|uniref:GmrSD restriction endonucleases N-terminal domain-containing protein n=1 Tax=Schizopora paradoxa TaxID=27342 RepID=A0A0H2SF49_9AGAM|nr:hypothetical protein SCHPADRAFT_849248 [Schizopora paradoxa]
MLSDYSSLTDISDDDEQYTPAPKGKKTREKAQYTIKPILKPPRQTTYSAKALYEQMVESSIDLNPEYQRDVVWTDTKQSNLIDSLLRNFVIPPVIFALHVAEDGTERRICIDGKQRLTSILRRTNSKHWYKLTSNNKTGKMLPAGYRQQFANKQIVCIEYMDIDDKAEREIFQRVQLGVALTPAERMQAISSPWADLVRKAVKVVEDTISNKLEWQSQRGRDFQCLASVIYLIDKRSVTFSAASSLELWMKRTTPPSRSFQEKIFDAISVFSVLLDDEKNAKTFQKPAKISPVEFIMVLYLIHEYMESASLKQLDAGISKLRSDVRAKHTDIRNNGKCNKTMLSFIRDRYPENLKSTTGEIATKAMRRIGSEKPRGSKRKREEAEDVKMSEADSDDDDVPLSKSPAKKTPKTSSRVTATPRVKAATTRSPTPNKPVKMEVDSTPSRSQQNGTAPKSDRLAAVRAAHAMLQSTPTPLSATSSTPRPPSRLSTDMGPPTKSAGSASQPHTPMSIDHPPPSSSVPPNSGGSEIGQVALSPSMTEQMQSILQKVNSTSQAAGPASSQSPLVGASQMSATQWPGQMPPPAPSHQNSLPAPQSAPVTDPRVRSNSSSSLPPRPASSYNNNNNGGMPYVPGQTPVLPLSGVTSDSSYRRSSLDSNPRSPALPSSSSRFDSDSRMDRHRESRFDDRSSKPPPTGPSSYRDRPLSPNSSRDRYTNGGSRGPAPPPRFNGRERDSGWASRR